eukprot:TRINITY_DN9313_c0_g1_i8.p1 TRINITY_DN9313_c0_g1~~TRINITY_DN9313_c0_g1_i8.p1  ORF type:complete len:333 (+),score=91.70 TRINITY_DN9313_c0_g1_i8:1009-2007(+)
MINGFLHLKKVELNETIIGNNSFVGPFGDSGFRIAKSCTIGAMTSLVATNCQYDSGSIIAGSPSFLLNKSDEHESFDISLLRMQLFTLLDTCGLVITILIEALGTIGACYGFKVLLVREFGWTVALVLFPCYVILLALLALLCDVLLKWTLVGEFAEATTSPLTGWFATRKKLYENSSEKLTSFCKIFEGSWIVNAHLRLLGAKVAMNCELFNNGFGYSEPDLIVLGENVFIGRDTVVQCHMVRSWKGFEFSSLCVGDGSFIGRDCCIMPGSNIGENCELGDLSLVMQLEHLPPNTRWVGSPCEQVTGKSVLAEAGTSSSNCELEEVKISEA